LFFFFFSQNFFPSNTFHSEPSPSPASLNHLRAHFSNFISPAI
jgi:hypothetical protein